MLLIKIEERHARDHCIARRPFNHVFKFSLNPYRIQQQKEQVSDNDS